MSEVQLKAKIAKLRALAANNPNRHEAQAATAKANELEKLKSKVKPLTAAELKALTDMVNSYYERNRAIDRMEMVAPSICLAFAVFILILFALLNLGIIHMAGQ